MEIAKNLPSGSGATKRKAPMISAVIAATLMSVAPFDTEGPSTADSGTALRIELEGTQGADKIAEAKLKEEKEALATRMSVDFVDILNEICEKTDADLRDTLKIVVSQSLSDQPNDDPENLKLKLDNIKSSREQVAERLAQTFLERWDQEKPKGAKFDLGVIGQITNLEGKFDSQAIKEAKIKTQAWTAVKKQEGTIALNMAQSRLHMVEVVRNKFTERFTKEIIESIPQLSHSNNTNILGSTGVTSALLAIQNEHLRNQDRNEDSKDLAQTK